MQQHCRRDSASKGNPHPCDICSDVIGVVRPEDELRPIQVLHMQPAMSARCSKDELRRGLRCFAEYRCKSAWG